MRREVRRRAPAAARVAFLSFETQPPDPLVLPDRATAGSRLAASSSPTPRAVRRAGPSERSAPPARGAARSREERRQLLGDHVRDDDVETGAAGERLDRPGEGVDAAASRSGARLLARRERGVGVEVEGDGARRPFESRDERQRSRSRSRRRGRARPRELLAEEEPQRERASLVRAGPERPRRREEEPRAPPRAPRRARAVVRVEEVASRRGRPSGEPPPRPPSPGRPRAPTKVGAPAPSREGAERLPACSGSTQIGAPRRPGGAGRERDSPRLLRRAVLFEPASLAPSVSRTDPLRRPLSLVKGSRASSRRSPFRPSSARRAPSSNASASFLTASRCAAFSFFGTRTVTRTCWSPRPRPSSRGMPFPLQREDRAPRRSRPGCRTWPRRERRDRHRAAQDGGVERHRPREDDVDSVAAEVLVGRDRDDDVEVPGAAPRAPPVSLARQAEARAVVDAGRDADGQRPRPEDAPLAAAVRARVLHPLAGPLALRAGAREREEALPDWICPCPRHAQQVTAAAAAAAPPLPPQASQRLVAADRDRDLGAERGLLERQRGCRPAGPRPGGGGRGRFRRRRSRRSPRGCRRSRRSSTGRTRRRPPPGRPPARTGRTGPASRGPRGPHRPRPRP